MSDFAGRDEGPETSWEDGVFLREQAGLSSIMEMSEPLELTLLVCDGWRILHASPGVEGLSGRSPQSLEGGSLLDLLEDEDRLEVLTSCIEGFPLSHAPFVRDVRIRHAGREERWSRLVLARFQDENPRRIICLLQDNSKARQLQCHIQMARTIFQTSLDGIFLTDPHGVVEMANSAFCAITGRFPAEVLGTHLVRLAESSQDLEPIRTGLAQHGHWQGEFRDRQGATPVWLNISRINCQHGHSHLAGSITDLSRLKEAEEQLHRLANFDGLTGLPNRDLFRDRLHVAISQCRRSGKQLALFTINMNRFKKVNESLGPRAGDRLLRMVAERLTRHIRQADTLARLAGDRFAALLSGTNESAVTIVARRILRTFDRPFLLDGQEVFLTVSVGISIFPNDTEDGGDLITLAEKAMTEARMARVNRYRFHSGRMHNWAENRLKMETDLRHGLERDEFTLFYQPRVDPHTGAMHGMEALLRWNHPARGMVSPMEFIPLAEETGLIIPLGEWVLRRACSDSRIWMNLSSVPLRTSVNISGLMFRQQDLPRTVSQALAVSHLPPERLELELTESVLMGDEEETIRSLRNLKDMGLKISLDDFGTGYSSLGYLKRFPIDCLKIDRAFIRDIPKDTAIAEAIVAMTRGLRLESVAEGVETPEQLRFLRNLGCGEIQGFFFSRPVPSAEFEQFVRQACPFAGCLERV